MTKEERMQRGDAVTYMALGTGVRCAAVVTAVRPLPPKTRGQDMLTMSSVDVAGDARESEPLHFTRIEIVNVRQLRPGTCCKGGDVAKVEKN
jgi:hypothetical protein